MSLFEFRHIKYIPYIRRTDWSSFSRVSLHSPFPDTVLPYPSSHLSLKGIYVDSSICSYIYHTQGLPSTNRHISTCPALQGKIPPESIYCLPTEFSVLVHTYPLHSMVGHSPFSPPLLSALTRRPVPFNLLYYSGNIHNIHTTPNDQRPTRHKLYIRSYFTIYVTTQVYDQGPSIYL